jgi:hypothetical protein
MRPWLFGTRGGFTRFAGLTAIRRWSIAHSSTWFKVTRVSATVDGDNPYLPRINPDCHSCTCSDDSCVTGTSASSTRRVRARRLPTVPSDDARIRWGATLRSHHSPSSDTVVAAVNRELPGRGVDSHSSIALARR